MRKSFRLRSRFETHGSFWCPDNPTESFTGRLARRKDDCQLTSSPVRDKVAGFKGFFKGFEDQKTFDLLHGFTTEGPCSLFYLQSAMASGLTDQTGDSIEFREYRV